MKLLDYLYVFSFAGASALIMQQMFNITLLSIFRKICDVLELSNNDQDKLLKFMSKKE